MIFELSAETESAPRGTEFAPTREPFGRLFFLVLFIVVLALNLMIAYLQLFSRFQPHDDEGCIALNVRDFDGGHRLYEEIPAVYGPLYYLLTPLIYRTLGWPIDSDHLRLLVLGLWMATSLLGGLFVWRLTRSVPLSLLGWLALHRHLNCLIWEPGHPASLAALFTAMVLVLSTLGLPRWKLTIAIGFGILAGAVVFLKLNQGVFLGVALLLALSASATPGRLARVLLLLSAVAAVLLPVVVMRQRLQADWVQAYCTLATVAAVLVVAAAVHFGGPLVFGGRELTAFLACGVGVSVAILLAIHASGTSWAGLLEGMILQHGRRSHMVPAITWPGHAIAALLSMALFFAYCVWTRSPDSVAPWVPSLLGWAKAMYGFFILTISVHDNHNLLFYGVPLLWLMVVEANGGRLAFPRLVLAALIAFQVSYAYPVAGSQSDKAGIFLTLAAVLCLHDSWKVSPLVFLGAAATWIASLRMAFTARFKRPDRLLAILVVICYLPSISGPLNAYRTSMPLALPGAEQLRLPEPQVACYRWLFYNLRAHTDTFLTLPGLYSLHFWTAVPAPTVDNYTHWFTGLDEKRQWRNLERLRASVRPGVVRTNEVIQLWLTPDDRFPTPATEQIERGYRSLGEVWGFALLLPADQPLPSPTYSAQLLPSGSPAQPGAVVKLILPALEGGPITRLCVCDLQAGQVLADTDESIPPRQRGFLCSDARGQEPVSTVKLVVTQPVVVYLRIPDGEALRKAEFPVVRLYSQDGRLAESIPFPNRN